MTIKSSDFTKTEKETNEKIDKAAKKQKDQQIGKIKELITAINKMGEKPKSKRKTRKG